MKVAFLGTPESAVPSLEALLRAGHEIVLAVTRPDRPVGRSRKPQAPPVKRFALERGIPVVQPKRVRGEKFLDTLRGHDPELLAVVAYGRILPGPVLDLARHGVVNVHFSLLPRYRGAAPVQWALARGETVTGVTTMRINERLDEGDVFLQRELAIAPGEHAPQLEERLAGVGASLLVETVAGLRLGTLTATPQDHERATFAPLLEPADGEADLGLAARELEGRIRGFDPWPGCWARKRGRRIRLVDGEAIEGSEQADPPGTVLALEQDRLIVVCGGGSRLAVRTLQPEGRRVLAARDAVNGRILSPGDRLEGRVPS